MYINVRPFKGSRKKCIFFSGPATKRGGKGLATKKKKHFFWSSKKIPRKNVATKLEGGGGD